jgi:DNA topoisomerase II
VNAADNRWRSNEMSYIDINVQKIGGKLSISIKNNGRTVPIEFDEKEKLYVPELIFGHLMTGSNFDDTTVGFVSH